MNFFNLSAGEDMDFGEALVYSLKVLVAIMAVVMMIAAVAAALYALGLLSLPSTVVKGKLAGMSWSMRLVVLFFVALIEELVFRGLLYPVCCWTRNTAVWWVAIMILSGGFTISHWPNYSLQVFFGGVIFSVLFIKTSNRGQRFWQGFTCISLTHFVYNVVVNLATT